MKFTIGTASNSLEFTEDIHLIKSSLLYADEIELIGIIEYAIFHFLPYHLENATDFKTLYECFLPFLRIVDEDSAKILLLQFEQISEQLKYLEPHILKKKNRTKREILAQLKLTALMNQAKEYLDDRITKLTDAPGANELQKLYQNGIIKIYDYNYDDFIMDEILGSYLGKMIKTIEENTSFPLFDKVCSEVVSAVINDKVIDISNVKSEVLRHAGIATNVLMTLPTLENAEVDELLDLKKDLKRPLDNFRGAIYGFSEKIESLPWDSNFQYDCMKLYYTEVVPNIEELNELASQTGVLKNMGKKVLENENIRRKMGFIAGGLATTITTSANIEGALGALTDMIQKSAGIGVSATVAMGFLESANLFCDAKRETNLVKQQMERNKMYFYYKLQKKLS